MNLRRLDCNDRNITAAAHLSPALGGQLGIHGTLDPGVPQRVRRRDLLPRISFVLSKIGLMIKIGFDVLRKCNSKQAHKNQSTNRCATKLPHI